MCLWLGTCISRGLIWENSQAAPVNLACREGPPPGDRCDMLDVIIIGGGVVGCAVARELSRYCADILLLEKTADICNGQSKANTAIVHGGYDALPGTNKAKYNVQGNRMYPEICGELDVPFLRNTSLVVSFSPEGHETLEMLLARGRTNGVQGLSLIGRDELRRREPNLSSEACEALLVEAGGICCPYELTQAYAENAAHNGVRFLRNACVTDICRSSDGVNWRVSSSRGEFFARAIVNCAGVYSDVLHNLVSADRLEIRPRRGEYYLLDKSYQNTFHATVFQLPTQMGKGVVVTPTVDGTMLIGPTADDIEDKTDTRTTADGLSRVLSAARRTWPELPVRGAITTFAGLRAHCDRDDFVLGEVADAERFFDAAGIESPGLSSAPAIGRLLAEEIADRLRLPQNPAFSPLRTAIPKFRSLSNAARAQLIAQDPAYGQIVCRCEMVTEAEIREAIRRPVGARTLDGVKRRTRAGMGRCQAGFCLPRTLEILAEELGVSPLEITKCGGNSRLLEHYLFEQEDEPDA